jgi:hypothetical protein
MKYYIGIKKDNVNVILDNDSEENRKSGILSIWGPFPSKRSASWIAAHRNGNPHFTTSTAATKIYNTYRKAGML